MHDLATTSQEHDTDMAAAEAAAQAEAAAHCAEPGHEYYTCPRCQLDRPVADFLVGGEDGETIVGGLMAVDSPALVGGNPSGRRQGLRIEFVGECDHRWCLEIVQHKGETFVFAKADAQP